MKTTSQDNPLNSADLVSTDTNRRMVILTDGHSNPLTAKTACSVLRYCEHEVLAVLDTAAAGQTAEQLLGTGGETPVIAELDAAPEAKTLLIGIAPPGGKIPEHWRPIIMKAIARGMNVLSGLHEFLAQDSEFAAAAAASARCRAASSAIRLASCSSRHACCEASYSAASLASSSRLRRSSSRFFLRAKSAS